MISPLVSGLILIIVSGLAGLRIGTETAGRFVNDLITLNKQLGEQNQDLAEMNHMLLKQVLAQQEGPAGPVSSESVDAGQKAAAASAPLAGPHSKPKEAR
jgi:hypothetical protein